MIDHGLNKKQLQSIQSIISDYVSVIDKVVIFGSRATGTYKNYSDIDLVLYGKIEELGYGQIFMRAIYPTRVVFILMS